MSDIYTMQRLFIGTRIVWHPKLSILIPSHDLANIFFESSVIVFPSRYKWNGYGFLINQQDNIYSIWKYKQLTDTSPFSVKSQKLNKDTEGKLSIYGTTVLQICYKPGKPMWMISNENVFFTKGFHDNKIDPILQKKTMGYTHQEDRNRSLFVFYT